MIKYFSIILYLCLFCSFPVKADNFFIELVQQSNVTDKDLQEASKQIKQHKDIELNRELSINPFHNRTEPVKTLKQPFCQTCHLAKPHRSNQRNRSFLNMHTHYIACETCHLQPEGTDLDYSWLAFDYPNAGQVVDVSMSVHTQADQIKTSIIPRPGARISPFYNGDPALVFEDDQYASEIKQKWKKLSVEDKAQLKAELHAVLNKKGHSCETCHSEKQEMLDFELLGANEKQSHSITSNKIAHFFSRYKKNDERLRMSDLLR